MPMYAQILHGKVHWIFESETTPQFAPNIEIVKVTATSDIQEGWEYDAKTKTFTPPEPRPEPEPMLSLEDITHATLLETQYQTLMLEMLSGF